MGQTSGHSAPLVAHIISTLNFGGLENGLINLINQMPSSRYRHAIVCLYTYDDFSTRLKRTDVPIFAIHKRPGKDLPHYARLWQKLRGLEPDITHTRNLGTLDTVLIAAAAGVKHRVHSEHGWDPSDLLGRNLKYRMLRRALDPMVGHYASVSSDIEKWLTGRIGVSRNKVSCVYNGVDSEKFRPHPDGKVLLPERGFADPETFVLGTIGRMATVKDQITLAKAFVRLLADNPNTRQKYRLVMIGSGELLEDVRDILRQGNALSQAWLPGYRADIADVLRGLDLFVLPSLNEGTSNTILEAMASGLPVLATRVGGNAELVIEDRTGSLVPSQDPVAMARAIANYQEHPERAREHGRAGRRRVLERFSLASMVSGYLDVYDRVLGEGRPSVKSPLGLDPSALAK